MKSFLSELQRGMQEMVNEMFGRWRGNAFMSVLFLILALLVNIASMIVLLFCLTVITSDTPQRFAWYVVSGLLISPMVFWISTVTYQSDVLSQKNIQQQ